MRNISFFADVPVKLSRIISRAKFLYEIFNFS